MGRVTVRRPVTKISPAGMRQRPDVLAAEEPLELRVNGRPLTVTMRTPGQDVDLAHGFLLTESVIGEMADIVTARYCDGVGPDGQNTYNVLDIALAADVPDPDPSVERNFYTTSSCGVCGKAALDAVRLTSRFSPEPDQVAVELATIIGLPEKLRAAQRVFEATGGLHAAGLFTASGELVALREDVGRHNAVDKVLGHAVRSGLIPLREHILLVSGRASFELVQKAAMAGVPVLAAVSAPSSLAVELAVEQGITLIGFLRGESMNIYSRPDRVRVPAPADDDALAPADGDPGDSIEHAG